MFGVPRENRTYRLFPFKERGNKGRGAKNYSLVRIRKGRGNLLSLCLMFFETIGTKVLWVPPLALAVKGCI